jgi:hypothetical protein
MPDSLLSENYCIFAGEQYTFRMKNIVERRRKKVSEAGK